LNCLARGYAGLAAAIAAHPEPAEIVFQDLKHTVVKESLLRGVACEPAIVEASQPAVIRANPQPIAALSERPHRMLRPVRRESGAGLAQVEGGLEFSSNQMEQ